MRRRVVRHLQDLAERLRVMLRPSRAAVARRAGSPSAVDLGAAFASPTADDTWLPTAERIAALGIAPGAGMNVGDRRALFHLICHLRPEHVLEIGTQAGASTVHLAAGLAAVHGAAERRLLTVDIKDVNAGENAAWRAFRLPQSPADAMRRLGYDRLVEFRVGRSLEVLGERGEHYDLVFLDGDHRLKTIAAEIPLALGRLRPGGLVLLHDFFPALRPLWPDGKVIDGPWLAVRRLQRAGWPLEVVPLGDLPWPTKLGTSRTSLALLGRAA